MPLSAHALDLDGLLADGLRRHHVPGASLAVGVGDEVACAAAGVLNRATGVEVTTDSLFQIGSVTKVWTTTLVLQLVAEGQLALDTRVVEILPAFRVGDPAASRAIDVRHLLTHTSGIDGDLFTDHGRGDSCVARYVDACADLPQLHAPGASLSYCNAGLVVAGRIVEVLTGQVWDEALRTRLIEPLGLTHTVTLPEEALRFRTAMGHVGPTGQDPAPIWVLPRALGPAGLICAPASDLISFARMHLEGGRAADGTEILRADLTEAMRTPQAEVPNPWSVADHWGLGWFLRDWGAGTVFAHNGGTIGQYAFLYVDPGSGVSFALLTNGGRAEGLFTELATAVFGELSAVVPPRFIPPAEPPAIDSGVHAGVYERTGARITVTAGGETPAVRTEATGELASVEPPVDLETRPVDEDLWAVRAGPDEAWAPLVFFELDGVAYTHFGGRATPKRA